MVGAHVVQRDDPNALYRQVATAMESITRATSQNLAGAKQMEASARNLDELGQRLKHMVERYRV